MWNPSLKTWDFDKFAKPGTLGMCTVRSPLPQSTTRRQCRILMISCRCLVRINNLKSPLSLNKNTNTKAIYSGKEWLVHAKLAICWESETSNVIFWKGIVCGVKQTILERNGPRTLRRTWGQLLSRLLTSLQTSPHRSVYPVVRLSVSSACFFVCLFICLSVWLSIFPSICLSVYISQRI